MNTEEKVNNAVNNNQLKALLLGKGDWNGTKRTYQ